MKTFIISDLHIGQYWKTNNARFSRARKIIQYVKLNLESFLTMYPNEKKCLILAGDIYNAVNANTEMLVYVANELYPILHQFDQIYAIAGNHETFIDREGKQRSLLSIGLQGTNIKVFDVGIHAIEMNSINYVFIPCQTNEIDIFKESLYDYLDKNKPNTIIAHMTPYEIFSFNKFKINDVIEEITKRGYNVPYILLGHYHMVKSYSYMNTMVVSIGNTYYSTILDVRVYNDKTLSKRALIIDDTDNKLFSMPLKLPPVITYEVKSQQDFDVNVISSIEETCQNSGADSIIYIKSPVLIDYSYLMTNGYDVYFDMVGEDEKETIISIDSNIDLDLSNASEIIGATLNSRWDNYLTMLYNSNLINDSQKSICDWLFNKRDDKDLSISMLINEVLSLHGKDETVNE